jgi:LacI family transcriptional regulator
LDEELRPEIIFCINDEVAYGAYKAIYGKGLKIPENIGVLAFGHQEFAGYLFPTLSIIEQYPQELGCESAKLLLEMIQNPELENIESRFMKTNFINGNSVLVPKP